MAHVLHVDPGLGGDLLERRLSSERCGERAHRGDHALQRRDAARRRLVEAVARAREEAELARSDRVTRGALPVAVVVEAPARVRLGEGPRLPRARAAVVVAAVVAAALGARRAVTVLVEVARV